MNSLDIEQVLGKTNHKNLFFNGKFPNAWDFESYHIKLKNFTNQTIAPIRESYTINNLGYNSTFDYTDSLTEKQNILCLGDSNTFGLLLKKELTWVHLLSQKLPEVNILNMGLPGAGADTVSRLAVNAIMALKGKTQAVLVVWPPYLRREFVSRSFQGMVYKTPNNDEILPYDSYWDDIDWKSNSYNFYKNKLLISSFCAANSVQFYDLEIKYDEELIKQDMLQSYGKEEYTTIGFKTHEAVANYFYKNIK